MARADLPSHTHSSHARTTAVVALTTYVPPPLHPPTFAAAGSGHLAPLHRTMAESLTPLNLHANPTPCTALTAHTHRTPLYVLAPAHVDRNIPPPPWPVCPVPIPSRHFALHLPACPGMLWPFGSSVQHHHCTPLQVHAPHFATTPWPCLCDQLLYFTFHLPPCPYPLRLPSSRHCTAQALASTAPHSTHPCTTRPLPVHILQHQHLILLH